MNPTMTVRAEELPSVPQMDVGAPIPLVVSNEYAVAVSYWTREPEIYGLAVFRGVWHYGFGAPSDETLHGHPLYSAGVRHYRAFEIKNSPLIQSLKALDAVHSQHSAAKFEELTHYFFAFHDSAFECVARSMETSAETLVENDLATSARFSRMLKAIARNVSLAGKEDVTA